MNSVRPAAVIILAAGEGTRMKSSTPKVLHPIGGLPLLGHAIRAARATAAEHVEVVVRHQRDLVVEYCSSVDPALVVADQDEVKGTGRAVECGLAALPADLVGTVLVTSGDVPLIEGQTLVDLANAHAASGAAVTVVTAEVADPTGYGRVVRGADGGVERIVEQKDASEAERSIREINSGIWGFDAAVLRDALEQVGTDNAQGEKYLTDVLALARAAGHRVGAHRIDDIWQTEGVNDRVQLAKLGRVLNDRVCEKWMRAGVTIVDPATTWIDTDVTIGQDARILPGTQLLGATIIGSGAVIGPEVTLIDTEVGEEAEVERAKANLAVIGAGATVGPYSYLRPGTVLGAKGRIGGFVETKNAQIGEGAKVPHLTYAGDVEIGPGANIGAGTIFANYDGVAKHRSRIGKDSFVGSHTVVISPVDVADGAYVAAGSALTQDVNPGEIAVARAKQRNVPGWVARARPGTRTAAAAEAAAAAGTRHTPSDGDDSDTEGER
ncbi:MAG TPA: bifunctional UDP-N-acetylglucosamine diphosphorylase/glucosamine-1-phosphate N-acetyltransferase GlmU [Phycicoccus elongatus]|uniref:bifunctional UDP-N-acetylglucosamine diphosphorylase/glucosamine-1-phosphate N-acetyltransferase GlmU n=1 Tax=Phycicoccus TaxID=367298 RepID=UPI002C63B5FA|nr:MULTISPECIES: bifunctional UDP-N-acetylglucosamine diphosphorylase/glucosamine-1-phosphate N-acetyltransferase GlmU [Phycicoccus]HPF77620.1 bifunctional UDP-N-acetylglucosamine diphosphorylase/glucosamine-1-phosphate N-acetyltransferase GlmU [Phycicoccus elongatus]HPK11514.1 bifunctional UDP-N-acetylglucosamine diphosphorylase/glucosamine-1-phosphate N-acetyltransferase GlmU [Phycicoccus elongatus]HPQ72603.1 bifunctional UDP-N-acetylglucosamine diphosphorylase/glucosamine-1-phosphate N-acetyl